MWKPTKVFEVKACVLLALSCTCSVISLFRLSWPKFDQLFQTLMLFGRVFLKLYICCLLKKIDRLLEVILLHFKEESLWSSEKGFHGISVEVEIDCTQHEARKSLFIRR